MSTSTPAAPRRLSAVRLLAGVVLIALLHLSMASSAMEIGAADTSMRLLAVGSALLLLLASWRNWPMIWNPLGRGLRSLVGERATRLAFASIAVTFALVVAI